GDFGTLKGVCGPAPSGEKNSTPDTQGVTADSIKVGAISDPGFAGRPGLNQELFDASTVFTKWCNDAGGINGRKLDLTLRDAALTEYKQRITESCAEDFALVGGGAVFDDTGQLERLQCMEPAIPAYVVTSQARGADLQVQPLPNALDSISDAAMVYVKKKFPDSIDHVGYMTGNVPATVTVDKQNQEAGKQLGFKNVYQAQYNAAGETSWTPFAQAIQSKGVEGLAWTGEPENLDLLLKALADIGYQLKWVTAAANHYDQRLIDLGGSAVKNVFIQSAFVPFFDASKNPPTQQYLDLFKKYDPKGKAQALLALQSWSAWLLFATSAKKCGADLTRKCMYDNAKSVSDWTGGGIHAKTDPKSNDATECTTMLEATSTGFEVPKDFKTTDGFFACDPKYVAHLTGNYGKGTTLADAGKTLADLK
ncbi:MAG: ABC transporter substrate-binding protein, partial [Acidimicrobiia bacterium]|nr:ABC transporter substrate-binding protein [Acidimicrobiia bacterium]